MRLKALAAGSAAALTLAGAAVASPSNIRVTTHHRVSATIVQRHAANGVVAGGFLSAAASYLGLDKATLVADLKAGQSLAQIAATQGKTADGLVTALLAPAKLKLDAAVTAGKLTSDRETTILTRLQTALTRLVDRSITPKTRHAKRVHVSPALILEATTSYLGVDLKTLIGDLRSGQTLAQVAVAEGKTADGLVAAVVASAKTRLDARVSAAGHITQQQETDFLTRLQANVQAFVSGSHS